MAKIEKEVSEQERSHAGVREKVLRNKAIVALYICGFSQRQISAIVKTHKRNVQLFIAKYTPKYAKEVMENIYNYPQRSLTKKPLKQ